MTTLRWNPYEILFALIAIELINAKRNSINAFISKARILTFNT
jgi:hypothetical protein